MYSKQVRLYKEDIYKFKCSRVKLPSIIDDSYVQKMIFTSSLSNMDDFLSWGLCGKDVSNINMDGLSTAKFSKLCFDENTIFSEEQKIKFNPQKLLELKKSFLSSMKELKEIGLDGTGINVGIIDSEFNFQHDEFCDGEGNSRIKINKTFYNHDSMPEWEGFHGKTVTSIGFGKNCGIACNSNIYLFCKNPEAYNDEIECIIEERESILKYILENNIKLDVISMSFGMENTKTYLKYKNVFEARGCTLIDSGVFFESFTYGNYENNEIALNDAFQIMYDNIDKFSDKRKQKLEKMRNNILIPAGGRTYLQVGNNGYMYNGFGSASWAIPEAAGIFAICKQLDPNISYDKFVEIVKDTSLINSGGFKYIDLKGMVIEINNRNKKLSKEKEEYNEIYKSSNKLISRLYKSKEDR